MDRYTRTITDNMDPQGQWVEYADAREAIEEVHQSYGGQADRYETRIAELEADYNKAHHEAQDARNDNAAINRELDRLGAPTTQPSGFGYSPLGRLRSLAVSECGEGLKNAMLSERNNARAENAKLREALEWHMRYPCAGMSDDDSCTAGCQSDDQPCRFLVTRTLLSGNASACPPTKS